MNEILEPMNPAAPVTNTFIFVVFWVLIIVLLKYVAKLQKKHEKLRYGNKILQKVLTKHENAFLSNENAETASKRPYFVNKR
jgi:hypothetical protein